MSHVVAVAREYLGTPFHHQGRVKGVGVDCVGLVMCVARDLGITSRTDPGFKNYTGYGRSPDGHILREQLGRHMVEVPRDQMRAGDVVCVAFDLYPQHVGIVADYRHGGFSIIHAASRHGKVIETRLLFGPAMSFVAAYRFSEVAWHNS